MIRLSSQGKKTTEIAQMWSVTVTTVLHTIRNFNAEGLKSLDNCPQDGGNIFKAQFVVLLEDNKSQVFVLKWLNHRIWDSDGRRTAKKRKQQLLLKINS